MYNNWYVLCFSVDCPLARPTDSFHYTDCRVSKTFDPRPGSGQELRLATPDVKKKHELV